MRAKLLSRPCKMPEASARGIMAPDILLQNFSVVSPRSPVLPILSFLIVSLVSISYTLAII
jgi:hypothetical protein